MSRRCTGWDGITTSEFQDRTSLSEDEDGIKVEWTVIEDRS